MDKQKAGAGELPRHTISLGTRVFQRVLAPLEEEE